MNCQKKHYYPKHILPQTEEIYGRYRRLDKIKDSCAGKGMHYAMGHLRILTLLTLRAEINGFPMRNYAGNHGETLLSAYRFYANCLATIHPTDYLVSDKIQSCEYYRRNKYPKHSISPFHLAKHLWALNSQAADYIITKDNQPLGLVNPLGLNSSLTN